jgi:predicted outer membrane repeat protein
VEEFIELNNSSKHNIKYKRSSLMMFALVLIGLVIIFSYSVGNVSAAPNTVYVNGSSGLDTYDGSAPVHTGTGNVGPVADLTTGIANVQAGGTVQVASGLYTGIKDYGITINKDVNINGQSKTTTIINAGSNGNIISNPGFKVSISNLTFSQGRSAIGGGAISNTGGAMTITNCNFNKNNGTAGNGGAIINTNSASLTVTNSNFNGNTAYGGGAIYNTGTVLVKVTGCTFTGNTATNNGGAINNDIGLYMTVKGCNFNGNTANGNGGAIDNVNTMTVTTSTFSDNTANANGGAIGSNGVLNVYNSTFTDNCAVFGSAIMNFKTFTVSDSTFIDNTATNSGGAIYNSANLPNTITDCTFTGNTASWGGGVFTSGTLTATTSNLIDNTASTGGAIYNSGTLTVTSSNLTGNTAINGGAIDNVGAINFQFNRFVGNSAFAGNAVNSFGTIVDVSNNWWGSNKGPQGDVVGTLVQSWLVLRLSANPTTIGNNNHSTITADLKYDNYGNLAGSSFPNGIPLSFTSNLGSINQAFTVNGVATSTFTSGVTAGIATIYASLDNQALNTYVTVKDTIPPKVLKTSPTNKKTGFSKTSTIYIKFSENIKSSTYYKNIKVKNLTTGKYVSFSKSMNGTTLKIKTKKTRTGHNWYEIIIPKSAIKDMAGNKLKATYTFKFKTKK